MSWEAVVKTSLSLPPSTTATVDDAAINATGSIPSPPSSPTTAIASINNCHCCCHTVNNANRLKPAVVVHHQRRQWRSSSTEVAMMVFVDGSCHRRRWRWDGGMMMQWHWQRWRLWQMVGAAMGVVIVNCAVAVNARGCTGEFSRA